MASLRLKFPEKKEPTTIVLSGTRVTLGRLPLNTIQIIDRTLSGFHAEFVLEEDHYRLHDRGSTNGTYVNGETVTDFHLRDACKISFGSLECEFNPEAAADESEGAEALPTRSEINAVRRENADLKVRLADADAPRKTSEPPAAGDLEKITSERDALQAEVARLEGELALLQRERASLRAVADSAKAEFASLESPAVPEPFKLESAPARPAAKPAFPLPTPSGKVAPKPPGPLPSAPAKNLTASNAVPPTPGLKPFGRPAATPLKGGTQKLPAEGAEPTAKFNAPPTKRLQPDFPRPLPKPNPPPESGR